MAIKRGLVITTTIFLFEMATKHHFKLVVSQGKNSGTPLGSLGRVHGQENGQKFWNSSQVFHFCRKRGPLQGRNHPFRMPFASLNRTRPWPWMYFWDWRGCWLILGVKSGDKQLPSRERHGSSNPIHFTWPSELLLCCRFGLLSCSFVLLPFPFPLGEKVSFLLNCTQCMLSIAAVSGRAHKHISSWRRQLLWLIGPILHSKNYTVSQNNKMFPSHEKIHGKEKYPHDWK